MSAFWFNKSSYRKSEAKNHVPHQSLEFSLDQMFYLKSIELTWKRTSTLFGVSRMTLYLKRKEAGILDDFSFLDISDEELEEMVSLLKKMPDIGEWLLLGALRSNGIFVQQYQLRQAIHLVDPFNMALHWHKKIKTLTVFQAPYLYGT